MGEGRGEKVKRVRESGEESFKEKGIGQLCHYAKFVLYF